MLIIVLQAEKVQLLSQNLDEVMGHLGHLLSTAELVGRPPSQREVGQLGCELGRTIGVSPSAGAALPRPRTADLAATGRQLDMESAAVALGARTTEQALQLQLRQTQHEVGWLRQALAAQPLQPQMAAATWHCCRHLLRRRRCCGRRYSRACQRCQCHHRQAQQHGHHHWQCCSSRSSGNSHARRISAWLLWLRCRAPASRRRQERQRHKRKSSPSPPARRQRLQRLQVACTQQGYYVSHHGTVTGMCIEIQVEEGLSH